MSSAKSVITSNRDAWNASAEHHKSSRAWATLLESVGMPDFSCLDATLTERLLEVGIAGKDVIQLGCNNGRESLSLFALGARTVVGLDQASAFLDQARELTARSPHAPTFVESDVHELPADLHEGFDVALITIGVLNWMPDIKAFFVHAAKTLRPGGTLVIYETHPFLEMLDPESTDPWRISSSYFQTGPVVEDKAIVYEGQAETNGVCSYWHPHGLGEIITGAISAGLRISHFSEYPHSNREEIYDIYEDGYWEVPMCYTLTGIKMSQG
ncbi:class I SAM-dependent methyltransferase [Pseudomonas sp. MWU13-2100]|uniref:class I SAM-dependent methyltransferase n=1 Tax=Pseudomonas sp. MWU13-2100 TaxID=2935075 RepID=UPI00200E6F2D|nr:class I SAM-dependent methyltransferase [Pseudomonas sp. MWU13-2100]